MKGLFERSERWVWYFFLATLAWQTRMLLWQADRVFQEWRSMSLYLSDILITVLIVFAVRRGVISSVLRAWRTHWHLLLFLLAAGVSLCSALSLPVGLYQFVRLLQGILLWVYLREYAWIRFNHDWSALAFVVGALSQAILGITQFMLQRDLGLRFLGETLLRVDMHGVAVFYASSGEKILRAYGSLPHPNVLALYLFVGVWMLLWLWIRHGAHRHPLRWAWPVAGGVLAWGLLATFSRTTIGVWLIAMAFLVIVLLRKKQSYPGLQMISAIFLSVVVFIAAAWPLVVARATIHTSDEAVQLRMYYASESLSLHQPLQSMSRWTGVGIGNFTTWLAQANPWLPTYFVAPVHNIYLLTYAEMGMLGVVALFLFLAHVTRQYVVSYASASVVQNGIFILVISFLVVGLMDHFLFTIQQGRILWWGVLALAASVSER